MSRHALRLAACLVFFAPACDDAKKDASADPASGKPSDKSADKEQAAEVAPAPAGDAAQQAQPAEGEGEAKAEDASAAGDDSEAPPEIGVPACDDYIRTMTACFDKGVVPANLSEAQRKGFAKTARGWADAVKANPASKDSVGVGCEAAAELAKRSFPKCFE